MATHAHDRKKTLAQWFCLLGGAGLVLGGLAGFLVDSTFDTGSSINGDALLGFEVNGWHNIVHLATGLLLLAGANTAPTARLVAIVFGLSYGLVTLIGLIDGDTVLGIIPVNPADNILHIFLTVTALAAGFLSPTRKSRHGRTIATDGRGADAGRGERFDRGTDGDLGYAHQGQREAASVSASEQQRRR